MPAQKAEAALLKPNHSSSFILPTAPAEAQETSAKKWCLWTALFQADTRLYQRPLAIHLSTESVGKVNTFIRTGIPGFN